jgi:putative SOS response-associated peptidase YedK
LARSRTSQILEPGPRPDVLAGFIFVLPPLSGIVGLMCRRFVQKYTWSELAGLYALKQTPRDLEPRYNIAPTTTIDVVRLHHGRRELVRMRWGLVPTAANKTVTQTRISFNARAETVVGNAICQTASRPRRCIIPAAGYYEWKAINGPKQPFYFSAADGGVLSIAGLWDECNDRSGTTSPLLLCTLIVTAANDFAARIHHRMPLFVRPDNFASWLARLCNKTRSHPCSK